MTYQFAPQLLLRMPVKNLVAYASGKQAFLDDPTFLAAIYLSSPVFYKSLERQRFQSAALSEKETLTLQKYINRYCFRPTPFGLFASVSLIGWADQPNMVTDKLIWQPNIRAAMPLMYRLSDQLNDQIPLAKKTLEANPSLYRVLNEYRFFRTGLDESGKQREYQLQSIAFSKLPTQTV